MLELGDIDIQANTISLKSELIQRHLEWIGKTKITARAHSTYDMYPAYSECL